MPNAGCSAGSAAIRFDPDGSSPMDFDFLAGILRHDEPVLSLAIAFENARRNVPMI